MLGELSGEHEAHGGLDLPGGEGRLLVVLGELSGLSGNALEDVVDERVHDGHALLGDASVGVDLLQHLVDVRSVGLHAALVLLGASSLLGRLGGLLGRGLGHFYLLLCGGARVETGMEMKKRKIGLASILERR